MNRYKLSQADIKSNYFHFTYHNNLDSIEQKGLVPMKGTHAKYIEESKKVFFVQGLDNLLILFDCWINVYQKLPILPDSKIIYGLGSKAMRSKCFPMFLFDFYFIIVKNSKRHRKYSHKVFNKLLDECVLLNLDIKENVDFVFSDTDEIKSRGYRKRHLKVLGYSEKYSDINSTKMDKWNLHTLANKKIHPNKIKLCYTNNSCSIRDILNYALKTTKLNLKEVCPNLYDYINSEK